MKPAIDRFCNDHNTFVIQEKKGASDNKAWPEMPLLDITELPPPKTQASWGPVLLETH